MWPVGFRFERQRPRRSPAAPTASALSVSPALTINIASVASCMWSGERVLHGPCYCTVGVCVCGSGAVMLLLTDTDIFLARRRAETRHATRETQTDTETVYGTP